jgi:hypothetical protein
MNNKCQKRYPRKLKKWMRSVNGFKPVSPLELHIVESIKAQRRVEMMLQQSRNYFVGGRQSGKQARIDAFKEILFTNGSRILFSDDVPRASLKGLNIDSGWILNCLEITDPDFILVNPNRNSI